MHYILGDGGHARELQSICGGKLLGKHDPVPVADVVIGVGDIETRKRLYEENEPNCGAVVTGEHVYWADAIQIMRGVTLCNGIRFGVNVLVNTGAQIDHDCIIGDHCVISPGAILCGNVTLGAECFIGAGAIIVQGVTLEPKTFVKAGTLVCGQDDMRVPQRLLSERDLEIATGPPPIWLDWSRGTPD